MTRYLSSKQFLNKKSIFSLFLLLLGAISLASGIWYWQGFQPVDKLTTNKIAVFIEPGSTAQKIATKLEASGVIRSALHFRILVKQQQLGAELQNGTFTLSPAMNLQEITQRLTKGSDSQKVTLKEGWRVAEMGEYLADLLPQFSVDSPEFKTECLDYEGYLFPETYFVPQESTVTQMCKLLRKQYGEVVTMQMREDMHNDGFTEEEIITLASIIQREAKSPEDMKTVSGVLRNRLRLGMPLQVDATLQYIKGYDNNRKTWWSPPIATDKQLNSPYNTYLNAELPPGPICNPGENAIMAATYPTDSEYLYYISNSDGSQMHYSVTYDEHLQNIDRYLR